jgi:valyl-tRNA synthetase
MTPVSPSISQKSQATSASLPKSYSPAATEGEIRARWDNANAFHADPNAPGEAFCVLIPPPNVTAALHLGHAFNNTLQDVLVRYHRMKGDKTLWMPGTDHAGISTQAVVEKRLLLQGKRRSDFTREQFIAKVQEWKDEYEATIIEQLKVMGCSCDFQRTRFTMDEVCAKAVREAFFRLFKDGLIYRGKRLVNWDPVTQTALADDEVEMEEVQGNMWYLRYPLVSDEATKRRPPSGEGEYVTVATTRPETMLGDTAVAINPKDPRAANLVGKKVRLPIVNREIPIIADDYVVRPPQYGGDPNDPKSAFATGFLKVTPAHDPNDEQIWMRHKDEIPHGQINIFAPDATVSDKHGWTDVSDEARPLVGLAREAARKKIVEWFKSHDLLEDVKPYTHSVGHSYRSMVPIEPYLSDQWYVKVTDDRMKGEALRAMAREQMEGNPPAREHRAPGMPGAKCDGELRFFPERYAKTFQQWHENLRDWCISRQLWWGHRIPVWSFILNMGAIPRSLGGLAATVDDVERSALEVRRAFTGFFETIDVDDDEIVLVEEHPIVGWYLCTRTRNAENAATWLEEFVRVEQLRNMGIEDFQYQHGFELSRFEHSHDIARKISSLINNFQRDPDVLDTWFSSGLWPLSTMGWPDPEAFPNEIPEGSALLNAFNPSTTLCTAREIITLWVSRMVMFNRYLRDGKLPFYNVYIHAMIQDGHGQKMSKSLGNGVDPRDIIHTHGADAMRFVLTQIATQTQDVRMPVDTMCPHCLHPFHPAEITTSAGYRVAAPEQTCPACKKKMVSGYGAAQGLATPSSDKPLARNTSSKFDLGRNFANKLWNATGFALSNLSGGTGVSPVPLNRTAETAVPPIQDLSLIDRWMIARLHRTLHAVEDAIGDYQFNAYADAMYDLVWRDFCDWYIEGIKPTIKSNPAQQQVLRTVLNAILRLLHPMMPFVTEALWPHVTACGFAGLDGVKLPPSDLLATAAWPDIKCSVEDKSAVATFERVQSLIEAIRSIKAERNAQKKKIDLFASDEIIQLIKSAGGVVEHRADLQAVQPLPAKRPPGLVPLPFEGRELLLGGLAADLEAERARVTKLIAEQEKAAAGFRSRLENVAYVSKAPPEKVQETRDMLAQVEADLAAARKALQSLQS